MKQGNVLLCGVGGQGILLASEILSSSLMAAGFDVKQSEVHGMAQRGGSVVSHVRFGSRVYSPLIELGTADITVSFELLEALRYLPYLRKGSTVLVNTQKILPAPVATGVEVYPDEILGKLRSHDLVVRDMDAMEIASAAGEKRAVNMVLVGGLSALLPVDEKIFLEVLSGRLPEKIRSVNIEAFRKGRDIIQSAGSK